MNSMHNLLDEVNLKTKPIKSSGTKYAIPNVVFEKLKLNTQFKLYHLEDNFNVPCCCAFFLFNDEWSKESLCALKEQSGANLLIGIRASDRFMEVGDIINSVICCKLEEVARIVHQFQAMLSVHGSYIAMDLNDIIHFFNQNSYTKYAETKLYLSDDFTEQNKQEVEEFIAKLPIRNIRDFLLYTHSANFTGLKYFSEVIEIVEQKVDDYDMPLYGMAMTNTLNDTYISLIYPIEPH